MNRYIFGATLLTLATGIEGQSVSQCINEIASSTHYVEESCTEVVARVSGPGVGGGRRNDRRTACLEASEGFAFAGAPSVDRTSCLGERCEHRVTQETNDEGKTVRICIRAHAWSGSNAFGPGGRAGFRMCADVERAITVAELMELVRECESR